jgi:hypothetical protein
MWYIPVYSVILLPFFIIPTYICGKKRITHFRINYLHQMYIINIKINKLNEIFDTSIGNNITIIS